MKNLKNRFGWVLDRPDFRYVGPLWGVAEQYELVSGRKGKEVRRKQTGKWRPYAPLQEPDLFLSFARLASHGKPTERSVLRWVEKYGLLRKAKEKLELKLADDELNQAPVSVEDFAAEAFEARGALDLYTDLSKGGVEDLRKRMGALREKHERGGDVAEINRPFVSYSKDHYFTVEWGVEVGTGLWYASENLQFLATVQLEGFVVGKLESVRPALWSDYALGSSVDRYRPTQSWECPNLISAVYLQFYLLITKGLAMRRCENPACGMPIPITRKNRKFCNPTCRSNKRHYE